MSTTSGLFLALLAVLSMPLSTKTDQLLLGGLPGLQGLSSIPNMPQLQMPSLQNFMPQMNGNGLGAIPEEDKVPCSCGVFLSGQFKRGSMDPPIGNPALLQELTETYQCNTIGEKQCINKCLETIMRHLANSPVMVCGSIDRDCHKERAGLFVKNCRDRWINSNLSAGREYCCKDGVPYKCPPN